MFLGPPIWGALSDRFGRKKLLILALIGVIVSMYISAIGISKHLIFLLLLGHALLGITDASDALAQTAVIDGSTKNDKSKNIGLVNFFSTFGLIIGPLFGGIFSDKGLSIWFDYDRPYLFSILLLAISIIGIIIFYKDVYWAKNTESETNRSSVFGFSFMYRCKDFKRIIIALFFMEINLGLFYQFCSLIMTEKLYCSTSYVGVYFALIALVVCITYVAIIPRVSGFLRNTIIAYSFLVLAFVGVIFLISTSRTAFFIVIIPMACSVAIIYSLAITMISDISSGDDQGKAIGISTAVVAFAFMLSGFVMVVFEDLNRIFLLFVLFSIIGFFISRNISTKNTSWRHVNEIQ